MEIQIIKRESTGTGTDIYILQILCNYCLIRATNLLPNMPIVVDHMSRAARKPVFKVYNQV